ncbi:hypothetical protein M1771_01815 [Spiroplasma citri]|uniref:PvuRts1 I-like SET and RING associated domain-containing protein n=1 Tax=Spiroplasma citri TaxID=2133 RepID=A0AAX3T131_SPICI|nr:MULTISPECIES: hypothetical protein [Spiroplasma]WFG97322.1 hypothetical protein M0C40_01820 [Spiroplasma citri]WFH01218.1 hypothetical protein M1771_01815 [Spiroplasma citri]
MSDDWTYIYYFINYFCKIKWKKIGIGYHFVGVFTFIGFLDQDCKTMIYQKIKNSYHFNK